MKVYVDELPKSCSWCPCFNSSNNTCKIDGSDVDCIHVDSYRVRFFNYTDKRHPICSLQSLADYTKQVRKEICEEIRDKMTHWEDCLTKEVTEYVIDKETLDKIEQGETK